MNQKVLEMSDQLVALTVLGQVLCDVMLSVGQGNA